MNKTVSGIIEVKTASGSSNPKAPVGKVLINELLLTVWSDEVFNKMEQGKVIELEYFDKESTFNGITTHGNVNSIIEQRTIGDDTSEVTPELGQDTLKKLQATKEVMEEEGINATDSDFAKKVDDKFEAKIKDEADGYITVEGQKYALKLTKIG